MARNRNLGICIIILVILTCLSLAVGGYIFYTKDVLYIYPATGQTENEILGQMGDYFGGILNPIVGIISVMLLWLAYSAQKEELKKTSTALAEQIALSRDENSRVQIVEIINKEYAQHEAIFNASFTIKSDPPSKSDFLIFIFERDKQYTLTQMIETFDRMDSQGDLVYGTTYSDIVNAAFVNYDPTKEETYFAPVWLKILEAKSNIERIHSLSLDLIKVIHLKNIERMWFNKFYNALIKCKDSGVLSDAGYDQLFHEMQTLRNEKFNLQNN